MDVLVLSPPVCTPSEPPSGAFLLTAGLAGHGLDVALLDLSLEFYHAVLEDGDLPGPSLKGALDYLTGSTDGYLPLAHRSMAGMLHSRLAGFSSRHPGWRLTLMDIEPPGRIHHPLELERLSAGGLMPFAAVWRRGLDPLLQRDRPRRVVISVAYLSQLAAAVDLQRHLVSQGLEPVVGGSLLRSLAKTGHGLGALAQVFPRIDLSDGMGLLPARANGHLLHKLLYPRLLTQRPYISARPVVPLVLSTGCFWGRCLFCPDRVFPFVSVPARALERFLETMPDDVRHGKPLIHLLDSALPPTALRRFLPLARQHSLQFYGFARPDASLGHQQVLAELAESGCLMLQFGLESASRSLLEQFQKGLDPPEAERLIAASAELGIRTYLYLLFGLPGEQQADRQATLALLARRRAAVDFVNLSVFNLPRYCELTERAAEFGIQIDDFPAEDPRDRDGVRLYYPFRCGAVSPRDEARRFLKTELSRHTAVRPALLRTPRWFRAAHLALMRLQGRRAP